VSEDSIDDVGPAGDMEDDLLDLGVADRRDTSRLACQISMTMPSTDSPCAFPRRQA